MKHLIQHLFHAGLNEREGRVYLSALSLGPATVQEIAQAADISRSSTYALIESLIGLGLLHIVGDEDGAHRRYIADSPERMVDMLNMQSEQLLHRKAVLERALPELCAFEQQCATRPRVYYYEGREGIHRLAERFERQEEDFVEIVPIDTVRQFFDRHEFDDHQQRLVRRRVKGRVLMIAQTPPVDDIRLAREQFGWEVRHIAPSLVPETGHVSVKGNEVYAFSYEGIPIGVIVESAPIASVLRRLFDLAWAAGVRS